jgi:hypothetical protein
MKRSKILGRESRGLRNAGEHSRADFDVVVEREYDVGPARTKEGLVGARLAFHVQLMRSSAARTRLAFAEPQDLTLP